jgi:hypothetical protein
LTIRNARCRGDADTLRTRLHLERALADVSLPGIGRLVVRALKLPGSVGPRALGRAVERGLANLHASAPRPWQDRSAASANAVLFADDPELLACFLRDWHEGRLTDFWFWGSLFGDKAPSQLWPTVLQQHAASLPAAFERLAAEDEAVPVAAHLRDAEAEVVQLAIANAYGVFPEACAGESPAYRQRSEGPIQARLENDGPAGHPSEPPSASLQRRLKALVPEIGAPGLSPVQRRFLALALGLARAPAWTIGPGLQAVLGSDEAAKPASLPNSTPANNVRRSPATPSIRSADWKSPGQADKASFPDAGLPADKNERISFKLISNRQKIGITQLADDPHLDEGKGFQRTTPQDRPSGRPGSCMDEIPDRTTTTAFGGIFYLLNVALALRLYGDFSQPRQPGVTLPPWDFLALAGQRWFGAAFTSDPVWHLLARLAGRSSKEPPGKGFRPPTDWQAPPGWLDPWGEPARIGVAATRVRLVLLHPAGFAFALATRREGETPIDTARALCQPYPMLERASLVHRRLPPLPRAAAARWMALLLDAVMVRLVVALGVSTAETLPLLCRHPAVLCHGPGRLDVRLSLADLPIAVRMAGLDRDPGWIPASGHAIAFRFE